MFVMHGMRMRPSCAMTRCIHRMKHVLERELASFYMFHMEPLRADKMPANEKATGSFFLPGALLKACQMATAGDYGQPDTLWGARTASTLQAILSHRLTLPACSSNESEGLETSAQHLRVEHAREGSTQNLPSVGRYAPLCLELSYTVCPLSNPKSPIVELVVSQTSLLGMNGLRQVRSC